MCFRTDPFRGPVSDGVRYENRTRGAQGDNTSRGFPAHRKIDQDLYERGPWQAALLRNGTPHIGKNEALK